MYLFGFGVAYLSGFRFFIPFDYFQLLGREALLDELFSSIVHLHAQPPMMNIVLGVALKLEWLFRIPVESWLLWLHFLWGGVFAVCCYLFAEKFLGGRGWALAAAIFILLNPALYLMQFHYFYPFHEMVILGALALGIYRQIERPSLSFCLWICALAVLLVYWRALFHPAWALVIFGALAIPKFYPNPPDRALMLKFRLCFVVSMLLLFAWPAKNLALFGFFGYSSWQGANFSTGLKLDPLPRIDTAIPQRFQGVAVLTQENKPNGYANLNYYPIIREAKERGRLARESLRRDPSQLPRKALEFYASFSRSTGRHPYLGGFGIGFDLNGFQNAWMRVYEIVLCQDFRDEEYLKGTAYRRGVPQRWWPSGFFILFPIVIGLCGIRTILCWRRNPCETRAAAYLLFCVLWVLVMILLVDGREGNRIRFSTEPYLILLVFWLLRGCLISPPKDGHVPGGSAGQD